MPRSPQRRPAPWPAAQGDHAHAVPDGGGLHPRAGGACRWCLQMGTQFVQVRRRPPPVIRDALPKDAAVRLSLRQAPDRRALPARSSRRCGALAQWFAPENGRSGLATARAVVAVGSMQVSGLRRSPATVPTPGSGRILAGDWRRLAVRVWR
jgi:hypothetical protein